MRQRGRWRVRNRKVIYRNPYVALFEDRVIRPDGMKGVFAVFTMKPGASILPLDARGYIYFAREFHYAIGKVNLEAIAGGKEAGETPLAAAKRELREETGMTAKTWVPLNAVVGLTTNIAHHQNLYLAIGLRFGKAQPDQMEQIEIVKMPFARALAMAIDGRISEPYTCTLLMRAAHYLRRRKQR